jgi:hypothetical protein
MYQHRVCVATQPAPRFPMTGFVRGGRWPLVPATRRHAVRSLAAPGMACCRFESSCPTSIRDLTITLVTRRPSAGYSRLDPLLRFPG